MLDKNKAAIELVRKGYDKIYAGYYRQRKGGNREIKALAKLLPRGATVLDVGCGAGQISKLLVEAGFNVTGIDISRNMLKLAKKKVQRAKFYRMNMLDIRFDRDAFDAVTSFYAIIHVPREYHLAVLKRINKILTGRGYLMISVGGTSTKAGTEENWMGLGSKMYWSHFGLKKNLQLIRKAGFRVLWHKFIGPKDDRHPLVLARKRL